MIMESENFLPPPPSAEFNPTVSQDTLLTTIKPLPDYPMDGLQVRLMQTMPVALMCIFWHQPTKSIFIEELVEIIKPIKQHLKRMDGRGYFTDISKAIQSSLNLKKTFNKDH
jgi:hypothetical protein